MESRHEADCRTCWSTKCSEGVRTGTKQAYSHETLGVRSRPRRLQGIVSEPWFNNSRGDRSAFAHECMMSYQSSRDPERFYIASRRYALERYASIAEPAPIS